MHTTKATPYERRRPDPIRQNCLDRCFPCETWFDPQTLNARNERTIPTLIHSYDGRTPGEEPVREWEIPAVRRYYRELDFFVLPPPVG